MKPFAALWRSVWLLAFTAAVGCGQSAPEPGPPPPPEVEVSPPTVREVSDYEEFTGRVDAERSVNILARVSGYLDKSYLDKTRIKEGSEVNKGDRLFVIDQRPSQRLLDLPRDAVPEPKLLAFGHRHSPLLPLSGTAADALNA